MLRGKIIIDLERRFGARLENEKLFECLVYDQVFVWLVVTPLFAGTWRGTWGNADSLFDTVIFNGDLVGSAFFCLFAGLALSSILMLRLETIEWFAKSSGRIRFLAVSRAFTIFKFYFDLLIWKGVWGLFDNVIGAPMPVSLAAMVVGMAVLAPLGAVRAIMCTPCGMGLDRPDTYVSVPMFLKTGENDSLAYRLGNLAATQSTYLAAVVSFYGTWKTQDNYFDDLEDPVEDKVRNAAVTAAVGLALCCAHAALQYLSLYCHDTSSSSIGWGVWPLNAAEALNNASHKALSVLGAVATVTGFRGAFILIDLTFMTENVLASRLTCQILGLFLLMFFYTGSSLHGGTPLESRRMEEGILISNFFLTYLLAKKKDSLKHLNGEVNKHIIDVN